ncbi:hypothetical protein AUJ68_06375 [Candidatus Woesearchaeota archaeon CG1_02_57_44]|nr:MAG: hypothetical protein AUJ68_06375 [Candidatus Woesearchaeota archaeon CG1_02_57_44]
MSDDSHSGAVPAQAAPRIIVHRVNTLQKLALVPKHFGVEVDIRTRDGVLVMDHEPWMQSAGGMADQGPEQKDSGSSRQGPERFASLVAALEGRFIVLNPKEDGLQDAILTVLRKHAVTDYFFLDLPFPTIWQLCLAGEHKIALRFSEHEPLEAVLAMKGRADWVWVDTFTRLPLDRRSHDALRSAGFKLCLVCPERWGRPEDIPIYRRQMLAEGLWVDAVMTALEHAQDWTAPLDVSGLRTGGKR